MSAAKLAWRRLLDLVKREFPDQHADLNPGCDDAALAAFSATTGLTVPPALEAMYREHDGQRGEARSVFDAWSPANPDHVPTSGYPFLSLEQAAAAWTQIGRDPEAAGLFLPTDIPFAWDEAYELYCVDTPTEGVYVVWTGGPDFTLPREWQQTRTVVAPDLSGFLEHIHMLKQRVLE